MKVGFTGTRFGMSYKQKEALSNLLYETLDEEFHHGDCLGADYEADSIARKWGYEIVIHPPEDKKYRAFCAQSGDTVWEPAPYLERNRDIVDSTDKLIAAPKSGKEELRSGTWATIRYARKMGKEVVILER